MLYRYSLLMNADNDRTPDYQYNFSGNTTIQAACKVDLLCGRSLTGSTETFVRPVVILNQTQLMSFSAI